MRMTTWAVLGSLFINATLAVGVAAALGVAAPARAGSAGHCAHAAPVALKTVLRAANTPVKAPAALHASYLVAARMGWAG